MFTAILSLTRKSAVAEKQPILIGRSYCVVWTSPATCRRWLFQMWKFRRFAGSQCGFNLFAR